MTKQDLLLCWMRSKKRFASHEVVRYGLENYYLRADRSKRDLLRQGIIRKLSDEEKRAWGYHCKDAVYEFVGEPVKVQKDLFLSLT